ncbi:MAG: YbaN family protein [Acetobacteraceae bacterium]|nr:YbaN family protein [Acetobacteraceae bacterium]
MALLGLGYGCLGLAALGAVLPLLPTTVFLIVAAWAFGRASPALRERLLADPRVGPALRDWQQHRVVSRRAKRAAALAMLASWIIATVLVRDVLVAILSGVCLIVVAAWLLSRPSEVPAARSPDGVT